LVCHISIALTKSARKDGSLKWVFSKYILHSSLQGNFWNKIIIDKTIWGHYSWGVCSHICLSRFSRRWV
jgi:hypothetical protein